MRLKISLFSFFIMIPALLYTQEADHASNSEMPLSNNWELSATFDISGLALDTYPYFSTIFNARWHTVTAGNEDWIKIERKRGTADVSAYGAYARSFFICEEDLNLKIKVEYAEEISIFFNGKFILHENNKTDKSAGSFEIYPRKGLNELFLFVISRSSDWKFRIISFPEVKSLPVNHNLSEVLWESENNLLTPESVAYDPENNMYYVSNFHYTKDHPTGFISRLSEDGKILEQEWIKGLFAPTGLCLYEQRLYIIIRNGVVMIDTKKGEYIGQFDIPGTDFLNDITVDSTGRIYISDSSGDPDKPDIYILENKEVKPWLQSKSVSNTNGIYVYHGKLLIGNNGEGLFQAVDLEDKSIKTICSLGAGTIDGIRVDDEGNYLVSHWEGKIFSITPRGKITEIFDTRPEGYNAADFDYINKTNTIIIPTYLGNKVISLKLKD
jgi:sugar lactone lactonase YvrE